MSRLQPFRPGFGSTAINPLVAKRPGFGSTDETSDTVLGPTQIAALAATGMLMRPDGKHFAYWSSDGRSPNEKLAAEAEAGKKRWTYVAVGAAVAGVVAGYLLGKKH